MCIFDVNWVALFWYKDDFIFYFSVMTNGEIFKQNTVRMCVFHGSIYLNVFSFVGIMEKSWCTKNLILHGVLYLMIKDAIFFADLKFGSGSHKCYIRKPIQIGMSSLEPQWFFQLMWFAKNFRNHPSAVLVSNFCEDNVNGKMFGYKDSTDLYAKVIQNLYSLLTIIENLRIYLKKKFDRCQKFYFFIYSQ